MSSALNIWDEAEQKYVEMPVIKGDTPPVDSVYNPLSDNPQSGKAVAQAIALLEARLTNT